MSNPFPTPVPLQPIFPRTLRTQNTGVSKHPPPSPLHALRILPPPFPKGLKWGQFYTSQTPRIHSLFLHPIPIGCKSWKGSLKSRKRDSLPKIFGALTPPNISAPKAQNQWSLRYNIWVPVSRVRSFQNWDLGCITAHGPRSQPPPPYSLQVEARRE
jgi:hypothetical protein